jgi:DHA1 family inner membrane transport protein
MQKERTLLLVLAAIQFTHIMDFVIMMPLGPQLRELFQITPTQFGFMVSAYTISAGVFGFLGAFFVDRIDRKTVLLTCYIGFTAGTFACAFAPSYGFLVFARIFTGAFGGVLSALIYSIIADAVPFERRGKAMSFVMAGFAAASILGVPAGLYLAEKFSWHVPFFCLGWMATVVCFLIWFYIPQMNAHIAKEKVEGDPFRVLTAIMADNNQLRALLLIGLLMLGQFTVIPFIADYMVHNVGFLQKQLMFIYLVGGIFSVPTSPIVGKWADKYGKSKIFTIFILLSIIPLVLITNMPRIAIPFVLMVTTFFFITSGGRMIPAMAMITSTVRPANRASFMSINSSVQQLAAGIAAFIGGAVITTSSTGELVNYQYVGYFAVFTSILCIFVAKKLRPVS